MRFLILIGQFSSHIGPFWSKLTQFGSHLRQFKRHSNNLYNIWDQMWVILDNLECLVYVIFWSSFSVNFGWSMCVGMLVLMCWHVGPVVFICRSWLCSFCRRILCLKTIPLQFECYLVQFLSHIGQLSSHFGPFWSKLTQYGSHLWWFRRHLKQFRKHFGPYLSHLGQFSISCLFDNVVFYSLNFCWSLCVCRLVLMC